MTIPSDRYDEGYRAGLEAAERECCRLADASRLASGERYMLKVAGERIRALATQPPDPAPFCQECGGVLQPLGKRCTDCGATWQTAAEMDALERYRPKPAPAPAPALDVAEVLPLVRAALRWRDASWCVSGHDSLAAVIDALPAALKRAAREGGDHE